MLKTLLFCTSLAFITPSHATIPDLYDRLIPLTTNDYYVTKLQSRAEPDFMRIIEVGDKTYTIIGFKGGTHLGITFIVPQEGDVQTIESGPLYSVLTKLEIPSLNEDEVLVLTSTGGAGEHHVFAQLMTLGKKASKVTTEFPLHGSSYQGGMNLPESVESAGGVLNFRYEVGGIQKKNDTLILTGLWRNDFENVKDADQKRILKNLGMRASEERFTLKVHGNQTFSVEGSKGVKKYLSSFMNIGDVFPAKK